MRIFKLFQNRSKFFFVYLGLMGLINGVWGSGVLLLINNKITNKPLPFFNDQDWLVYIVLILISFIIARVFQRYMIKLTFNFGNELGLGIFNKLRFANYEDYNKLGEERVRTAMGDVADLSDFPNFFLEFFNAAIMVIIGIVYLFLLDPFGATLVAVNLIVLASIYLYRSKQIRKDLETARDLGNIYMRNVNDFLRGFKQVKMSIKRNENIFEKYITENRNNFVRLRVKALIRAHGNELLGAYAWYVMIGVVLFVLPFTLNMSLQLMVNFLVILLFLMGPIGSVIRLIDEIIHMGIAMDRLEKFNEIINASDSVARGHGDTTNINERFESIRFEDITYEYVDKNKLTTFHLGPINLEIKQGEIIFVTGGNGSGKSTFINVLTGLFVPKSGRIYLNGHLITPDKLPFYRDQLSCVFAEAFLFSENYFEHDLSKDNKRFMKFLNQMRLQDAVNFDDEKNRIFHTLSKGQQKRVALIYSLMEEKDICIFDEWAAEQDPNFRKYFYEVIIPELKQMGKTVIAITHDDMYFNCTERLIKFDYGKIIKDKAVAWSPRQLEILDHSPNRF